MHFREDPSFYPRFKFFLTLFIIYPLFLVLRIFQFELWVNCYFNYTRLRTEYGNIDQAYGAAAQTYIKWGASMVVSLDTGFSGSCVSKLTLLHLW